MPPTRDASLGRACAQGRAKLQEVSHLKEAEQLLRSMLTFKPKGRPSMRAVMSHPFWWSPHQRLSFLIDMSDRMENEDREVRGLSHALRETHDRLSSPGWRGLTRAACYDVLFVSHQRQHPFS